MLLENFQVVKKKKRSLTLRVANGLERDFFYFWLGHESKFILKKNKCVFQSLVAVIDLVEHSLIIMQSKTLNKMMIKNL